MKAVRLEAPRRAHAGGEHDEHFEPVHGLPEALPAGEKMLWQGSPDWRALARNAFHVNKLVLYFAALVVLRLVVLVGSGEATLSTTAVAVSWMGLLGAAATGGMLLMAWLSARTAVYTITDKRVVMRVGIVLTLSFNIPFKRIAGAGLHVAADGTGDLPLMLSGEDRIAFLHLWPHARPWRLARPEPMLRSVPQAAAVAALLSQAWSRSTGQTLAAAGDEQDSTAGAQPAQPALASR